MADIDTCKICGKNLHYYVIVKGVGKKGNEKHTHRVFHEGDEIPTGATEIHKMAISPTYRNRLRGTLKHDSHDKPLKAPVDIEVPVVPVVVQEGGKTDLPPSKVKVDISELNHNKFALVGAIVRELMNTNTMSESDINSIRSELISCQSFEHILSASSSYVDIVGN